MSNQLKAKIYYKEYSSKVLANINILDNKYNKFEEIKKLIFEKSVKKEYDKFRVKEKDTFVLEIENSEIEGLNEVFDEASYKYFYDSITQKPQEKLKLFIIKKDFPINWKPPKSNKSKIVLDKPSEPKEEDTIKEEIKKLENCKKSQTGTKIKIYYQEEPTKVLININILDNQCSKYEEIKKLILEKSKKKSYEKYRVTDKDKFELKIDGFKLNDLNEVWNEATYKYFYDSVIEKMPEKIIKLIIIKVKEYKTWEPPEYYTILEKSLKSEWDSTKKEIENELTEKFLIEGNNLFIQDKKTKIINENSSKLKDNINDLHFNIICNKCFNINFIGVRYICCECKNYNLCESCYVTTHFSHNQQHVFMKIQKPIEIDYHKFSNIFSPNTMSVKQSHDPFEIEVNIINNGQEPLEGCFLSPIRFGEKYLGCLKTTITDECHTGDKITLKPLIKFEDDDNSQPKKEYEGYFKLLNEEGIPFGDILYIQVLIKD